MAGAAAALASRATSTTDVDGRLGEASAGRFDSERELATGKVGSMQLSLQSSIDVSRLSTSLTKIPCCGGSSGASSHVHQGGP